MCMLFSKVKRQAKWYARQQAKEALMRERQAARIREHANIACIHCGGHDLRPFGEDNPRARVAWRCYAAGCPSRKSGWTKIKRVA